MQTDQVLPPIRVVFDVTIKGAALKLVTVRSALLVENKLSYAIELQLDNNTLRPNDVKHMVINADQVVPVPLPYAWSKMTARPAAIKASEPWKFSEKPIDWYHILTSQDNVLSVHTCWHYWRSDVEPQRF